MADTMDMLIIQGTYNRRLPRKLRVKSFMHVLRTTLRPFAFVRICFLAASALGEEILWHQALVNANAEMYTDFAQVENVDGRTCVANAALGKHASGPCDTL